MGLPTKGEIEGQARWVLGALAAGAVLLRTGREAFSVGASGPQVRRRFVVEFHRRDWLKPRGTAPESFALSDAGLFWLRRQEAEGDPFATQHRLLVQHEIEMDDGTAQTVTVNEGESPLGWLFNRGGIDAVQLEAGERLRRDFTLAGLTPRMAIDLAAPVIVHAPGSRPDPHMSELVVAAKQRFQAAMGAAGPVISDLLFDICCHLVGLDAAETARNWPRRSAKIVLSIGLEKLAAHYGLRARRAVAA